MSNLEKSNPFPPRTPEEIEAQRVILTCADVLRFVAMALRGVRASLPERYSPEDAEAQGEYRTPQSLTFSLIGSTECILADEIEPAINSLDEAGNLSPSDLFREWQEKQAEKEGRP